MPQPPSLFQERKTLSESTIPAFSYKKVFVSDTHLGSGKTAAPYLYEFLSSLDFDVLQDLYIVGDFIGGWEHGNRRQQPFPEMERRVLDIVNYAAAHGVRVHMIPGNHDEALRPLLPMLAERKTHKTFHENIIFEHHAYYETEGPDKKRLKIVHGDEHDPGLFFKTWFKPVVYLTSATYDTLVMANYHLSNFLYDHFGMHVSYAKEVKNAFKSTINYFFSHQALLQGIEQEGLDGVIMGHTHMAGTQIFYNDKGRPSWLINDGDWVESATAAYVDSLSDLPQVIDYKKERERRGFGDLPDEHDRHPDKFAAYRWQTERQVRLIHMIWPGRDYDDCYSEYRHARIRLEAHREHQSALLTVMAELDRGLFTETARKRLSLIFAETEAHSYPQQKQGLRQIFNKCADGTAPSDEDLLFLKTVVRELGVRCERKIAKHEEAARTAAERLDLSPRLVPA